MPSGGAGQDFRAPPDGTIRNATQSGLFKVGLRLCSGNFWHGTSR